MNRATSSCEGVTSSSSSASTLLLALAVLVVVDMDAYWLSAVPPRQAVGYPRGSGGATADLGRPTVKSTAAVTGTPIAVDEDSDPLYRPASMSTQ